jgi:hypothetical protein
MLVGTCCAAPAHTMTTKSIAILCCSQKKVHDTAGEAICLNFRTRTEKAREKIFMSAQHMQTWLFNYSVYCKKTNRVNLVCEHNLSKIETFREILKTKTPYALNNKE